MTLAAGSTFGHYQVLSPLGRGGMATVYKVYEPGLDRYVALKVLPREFIHDPGFAARFEREAKVIARLEHPNIIPIHNFGIEAASGTPWMAMRFIAGGTLSTIIKGGRLAPARAIGILRGVADALDYAHGKGVIHRDVKPQNILLDDAERVYLADFGIAKMVENSPGLTVAGMVTGTPQYMAPEQAMGRAIDKRVDIYALGIVAYEMLTGCVPFSADTPVAVLMKQVTGPIPVPSPQEVPEGLTRVLLKALAKQPEERWPSAGAFLEALELGQSAAPTAVSVPAVDDTPTLASDAGQMATAVSATVVRTAPSSAPPRPEPTLVSDQPPEPMLVSSPPTPPATGPDSSRNRAAAPQPSASAPSPLRGMMLGAFAAIVLVGIIGAIVLLWPRARRGPDTADGTLAAPPSPAAGRPSLPPSVSTPPHAPVGVDATTTPRTTRGTATPSLATPVVTTLPEASEEDAPTAPVRSVRPTYRDAGKVARGKDFFEKTLTFVASGTVPFDAAVGPLRIPSIHFTQEEARERVTLQALFPIDCPKDGGDWNTKIQLYWLAEDGDKLEDDTNRETCRGEALTSTLRARNMPAAKFAEIRGVRIRFEASPD